MGKPTASASVQVREHLRDKEPWKHMVPLSSMVLAIKHVREQAHTALVEALDRKSIKYEAREITKLPDSENPLNLVN